ncbi:MAG: protein kinase [Phycisphaeraceae bacterium]|nr:protein kinase [Phycisphaeraceae bacterium]
MSSVWDEKSVYLTAVTLRGEDREAFLQGACPTPEARARIDRLLSQPGGDPDEPTSQTPPVEVVFGGAAPGTMLDEFRLLREIGRGGMGTVYLAEDTLLHREVAVKVLAEHLVGSERALARFRDEARNAAGLRHASIVPVYKLGTDGGLHYIVSEYVDGTTLSQELEAERRRRKEGGAPEGLQRWQKRAAQIAASIADALDCSHRAGILHRDVKPSNILLERGGGARLTDFGIAKRVVAGEAILHTQAIGTCHYMSPEQASVEDARIDQRSDVFSLGAVLYEMLTLRRAFDGADASQVLKAVMSDDPPKVRSIDRTIPRDLETICHKALEKSPARRYQSAAHLSADLRAFLGGLPILARPPGIGRRVAIFSTRHRVAIAIGAFFALGLALLISWNRLSVTRDAAMSWVTIESGKTPVRVLIQRCDDATLELQREARDAGTTPIRDMKLSPGQYRITLETADGLSFAEFNAVLLWPGPGNRVHLEVVSDGSTKDRGGPQPNPGSGRRLDARLISTETVVRSMVGVDTGEYRFGWAQVADPLMKERTVNLPRFFIDRTKVSNREYGAFLDATGRTPPPHWQKVRGREALDDLPVANVSLEDAEAFARWCGKRLPTVFEWQAAMRGPAGWRYPTGETLAATDESLEPTQTVLLAEQSWDPDSLFQIYASSVRGVHTPDPLATPSGIMHCFDSVRELCANMALPRQDVVMQGRAWSETSRFADLTRTRSTPFGGYSLKCGFRCAKSAAPPGAAQH